eukprot:3101310-Prymnesium_polylepis.1
MWSGACLTQRTIASGYRSANRRWSIGMRVDLAVRVRRACRVCCGGGGLARGGSPDDPHGMSMWRA